MDTHLFHYILFYTTRKDLTLTMLVVLLLLLFDTDVRVSWCALKNKDCGHSPIPLAADVADHVAASSAILADPVVVAVPVVVAAVVAAPEAGDGASPTDVDAVHVVAAPEAPTFPVPADAAVTDPAAAPSVSVAYHVDVAAADVSSPRNNVRYQL